MADSLPAIDIKISVEPSLFLERMRAIGTDSGRFIIEHVGDMAGGTRLEVLNFRLTEKSVHDEHGFQLIARDEKTDRIQVELRARRWSREPPTRAVYEQAARDLVQPLLRIYNRSFRTRHRLRKGAREQRSYTMSDITETLLARFTTLANTHSLHPYDWRRFYLLVREARQEVPDHIMRQRLEDAGFTPDKARDLAQLYVHLWSFKRLR